MNSLDARLGDAVSDLDRDLERLDPPPFRPKRSATPAMLVLVLLLGIGIFGYVARSRPDNQGGISVATQPEVPEVDSTTGPDSPDPVEPVEPEQPEAALSSPIVDLLQNHALTNAATGEFFMPLPGASAWNIDETRLLLYRTGEAAPGHIVLDLADPSAPPIDLPVTPPDIEQVYWHPFDRELLLYANDADLVTFDLSTMQPSVTHSFDACDRVDSGVLPVPPSADGTISLLCHRGTDVTQLSYNLTTAEERRAPTQSDTAALPSPSGAALVRWNTDGSASVLDRELVETGVVLDLGDNLFDFVVDRQGVEWVATTLFDGPAVGSLVLLPLDGQGSPTVVIGPSRGDVYPPVGTLLSARGSQVAVSISGTDDGLLAGRITIVDLSESFDEPGRSSVAHGSEGRHGYWSTAFVSLSPSGQNLVYASDSGTAAVNTYGLGVAELSQAPN